MFSFSPPSSKWFFSSWLISANVLNSRFPRDNSKVMIASFCCYGCYYLLKLCKLNLIAGHETFARILIRSEERSDGFFFSSLIFGVYLNGWGSKTSIFLGLIDICYTEWFSVIIMSTGIWKMSAPISFWRIIESKRKLIRRHNCPLELLSSLGDH